jgi:hypothetical protein
VRLLTTVQTGVQSHVAAVREGFPADGAAERPLSGVGAGVLPEQHLPTKPLAALLAGVGFLPGVDPDVHIVGNSLVEPLLAVFACIFLPVTVDFEVGAQVTAVVELLTALGTCAGELPSALVN